jgi:hypothetical protein
MRWRLQRVTMAGAAGDAEGQMEADRREVRQDFLSKEALCPPSALGSGYGTQAKVWQEGGLTTQAQIHSESALSSSQLSLEDPGPAIHLPRNLFFF